MKFGRRNHITRAGGTKCVASTPLLVLGGAAMLGAVVGVGPALIPAGDAAMRRYGASLDGCSVTDGDTIRCSGERIRLLGIDASELPDHCRPGRDCAPGDPWASTRSLTGAMVGSLTIERVGTDRYGRTLALVAGTKGDLSCWQLDHDQAIYKARWDDGLRVARACPGTVLRWR